MEQLRQGRKRTFPDHLRDLTLERAAAAVGSDHSYSCISKTAVKKRHLENAAVLPVLRPAAPVSSVGVHQQEEPLSIHGRSVQDYQQLYNSVAEPIMKTRYGRRHPYSLKQGLDIKQRLWERLERPVLVETEGPDGRITITESRSRSRRSVAPRFSVVVEDEPEP